ncbi:hypothetical protein GCM10023340_37280 [Nocardioides marinquilinus]|uniref:DEAD/DEAH box helicase n=1 Tax=Nocardioides marinquilinus TaxID=1210400 RepID=A0ABP9PY97_9ACTN
MSAAVTAEAHPLRPLRRNESGEPETASLDHAIKVALASNPWSDKREILRQVRDLGLGVDGGTRELNSRLYQLERAGEVRHRGEAPPQWCLTAPQSASLSLRSALASAELVRGRSHGSFERTGFPLRPWQLDALEKWEEAGRVGVVQAVTGTGKTMVGIEAAHAELARGGKVLVVVPTRALVRQWDRSLVEYFGAARVGRRGDGHRDTLCVKDIVVTTVHSAPFVPLDGSSGLLIADECHRYGSESWSEHLNTQFEARLGLSATYARGDDGDARLAKYFGPEPVFEIDYRRAIREEVVTSFRLAFIGVRLSQSEQAQYDQLSRRGGQARKVLEQHGFSKCHDELMRQASAAAKGHADPHVQQAARRLVGSFNKRRALLADTDAKRQCLRDLEPAIAQAKGTLIFTQTKNAAVDAAQLLSNLGHPAGAIYGELDGEQREQMLDAFRSGVRTALAAPRVLDEGIDVPEADLGVVVSASNSRRQMIQRMGRVLRLKTDGRIARLVVLYAEGTTEDPAKGALSEYTSMVWDVADEARVFPSFASSRDIVEFLKPKLTGPKPPPHDRGSADWFPLRP